MREKYFQHLINSNKQAFVRITKQILYIYIKEMYMICIFNKYVWYMYLVYLINKF